MTELAGYRVYHPESIGPFRVCSAPEVSVPPWARKHCYTCSCPLPVSPLRHGEWVTCGTCRQLGVIAEPGYETAFCPDGIEVSPDGRSIRYGPAPVVASSSGLPGETP